MLYLFLPRQLHRYPGSRILKYTSVYRLPGLRLSWKDNLDSPHTAVSSFCIFCPWEKKAESFISATKMQQLCNIITNAYH